MGSGGGVWDNLDEISAARMNQKTVFVGDSAPSPTYAGQLWFDTSTDTLKVRNAANDAWKSVNDTVILPVLTSDPASPVDGQIWLVT